jgi:ADP-ribose pyrophosphatase
MEVTGLEVVEDRTAGSLADEGFLRVRRYLLRHVHADGSRGEPYPCDVMSRKDVDAVAVVLYERAGRRVQVVLKEGVRPPVWLRRTKDLVRPDDRERLMVTEIAAGVLESGDRGDGALERRAAAEAEEECGTPLDPDAVRLLGGASFPSPGVTDEKVFFASAAVRLAEAADVTGDGSGMEEGTRRVVMDLRDAVTACRDGRIPDMKTELALLRLCDQLGYLPQLDAFVDELPEDVAARFAPPGIEPA